jgi:hypothetical protein
MQTEFQINKSVDTGKKPKIVLIFDAEINRRFLVFFHAEIPHTYSLLQNYLGLFER